MKHPHQWAVACLCALAVQGAAAQSFSERLRNLSEIANAVSSVSSALNDIGLRPGKAGRSTSTSADDPVFGKARFEARGYLDNPPDYWPWKMAEGYIARDKTGCPNFYANGQQRFVYSMDRFEQKVDGKWVALDMKKIATEVPDHCTGGGG